MAVQDIFENQSNTLVTCVWPNAPLQVSNILCLCEGLARAFEHVLSFHVQLAIFLISCFSDRRILTSYDMVSYYRVVHYLRDYRVKRQIMALHHTHAVDNKIV